MLLTNVGPIKVNPAAVQELMSGPSSPVYRDMERRAFLVRDAAKKRVRYGHVRSGKADVGGGARINLRDSIHVRMDFSTGTLRMLVGSDNPIALLHHEGSQPHIIRPRVARVLRFMTLGGQMVFAREVHHPGTRPNRYLTDNLRLAGG